MTGKDFEKKQPFIEHLIELRACIIKAFIGWGVTSILVYVFSDEILEFIINPLRPYLGSEHKVYFRGFADVFSTKIKLSVILGFVLGSPYIIYQIWT
ncbi:MAG: twin-arginine translocase subunit TatC, partial [Caldimicrobium sp.]